MGDVPPLLRVGTPQDTSAPFSGSVSPPASTPTEPYDRFRRQSSASSISSYFPSRPASIASPLDPFGSGASRRTSLPSPLTPGAGPSPAYRVPDAPPPPSFLEHTSYDSSGYARDAPHVSRRPTVLQRLTSLRSARWQSRYGVITNYGDDDHVRLRDVEEEGDVADAGMHGPRLEGPIGLRPLRPGNEGRNDRPSTRGGDGEATAETALAEEYYRLEGHRRMGSGAIGHGMTSILDQPFEGPQETRLSRGPSVADARTRHAAQDKANATGEVIAVMDVGFHGADAGYGESTSELESLQGTKGGDASYFFPTAEGEMPNWKPVSMRWPYLTVLIVIALALAALQEYLCQLSIRRARHDDGLIKFVSPNEVSMMAFFAWKYLPTLVLVSFGVLWQITDYEVKRLEPYYQLSKEGGATAAESLNIDYLTFFSYLTPVKAIRYRQWAVLLSSSGYLLAGSVVPVLQSASLNLEPDKEERRDGQPKFVRIDPRWSRSVTAALVLIALCGVILAVQLRRKSGLQSDPKGIAGVAAMATKSHILNDFHDLDTAPNHVIHKRLRHRRYKLFRSSLWQGEMIKVEEAPPPRVENPHPMMLRLSAGIPYIVSLFLFLGLLPVLMFVPGANIITRKLPWLLTLLATIVKLVWTTFDSDIRVIEPYYILSRRHAPPATLTLDYTGTIPGWIIIKAALNGHFLVSVVGLGAIMAEVLTVVVSSFNVDGKNFVPSRDASIANKNDSPPPVDSDQYNSGETFHSFWISFGLAVVILLFLSAIAALVYVYRRHPFLPRQPGTIASVLAFVHQSKMLDPDFTNTEELNSKEMTMWLEKVGKTYGLGWFRGRDSKDHCGVDEEELDSHYVHGEDRKAQRFTGIGGDFNWDTY